MNREYITAQGYRAGSIIRTCIQASESDAPRDPGTECDIAQTLRLADDAVSSMIDTLELARCADLGRDPHAEWSAEYKQVRAECLKLSKKPGGHDFDTPEIVALEKRGYDLEELIFMTPAKTVAGAVAQIQFVQNELARDLTDDRHAGALASAIETLRTA